jgi:hypothetical protein
MCSYGSNCGSHVDNDLRWNQVSSRNPAQMADAETRPGTYYDLHISYIWPNDRSHLSFPRPISVIRTLCHPDVRPHLRALST